MTHYNTIEQEGFAEYKEKGSRFLAFSFPFNDTNKLKVRVQNLKKEHPKAGHFCFAYRIGNEGNIFRSSDDKEPAGSAGKPILGIIDSKAITDVLIIVVRYFGGTLLGIPGLINAYKSSAVMSLQVIPIIRKPILFQITIEFDYTNLNEISTLIKQYNCQIIHQENMLFSTYTIAVPLERKDEVLFKLRNLHNVGIS